MYNTSVEIRRETVDGVGPWVWPASDIAAWHILRKEWAPMRNIINTYVKDSENSIAVQAGGCAGMFPRLMSDHFGLVYTFEPHPLNFHCLVANCAKDNIIKIQGALGRSSGTKQLIEHHPSNAGMHWLTGSARVRPDKEKTGKLYSVQCFSIDDLNLPECGLIQLDIEGSEFDAISGALKTILMHSPVIVCEFPEEETVTFLNSIGYTAKETLGADTVFVS